MTEITSTAVQVALAYYEAWTHHDVDRAMAFIAEDISCDAPSGRLHGAEAFRGFMEPFSQIVTRAQLLAAFGDDSTAMLMYDTDTVPVQHAPGAEYLKVQDGLIRHITIVFDRVPFSAARQAAAEREKAANLH